MKRIRTIDEEIHLLLIFYNGIYQKKILRVNYHDKQCATKFVGGLAATRYDLHSRRISTYSDSGLLGANIHRI